jgi:hypothetical protein
MNARVSLAVPADDVRWCALLAERLSVCCAAPSLSRMNEVRAILAAPPPVMLPLAWDDLVNAARAWLTVADADAPFKGIRLIEAALRDLPVPVPAWAGRYQ